MTVYVHCKHCGTGRAWDRIGDAVSVPVRTSYRCASSPTGECEPRELATQMSLDSARDRARRIRRG